MNGIELRKLLKYSEASEILGISQITLRKWVSEGRLKSLKLGRSVRFYPETISEFLQSCERIATSKFKGSNNG